MCKGDDLDDGVLMPKLANKSNVVSPTAGGVELRKREFLVGRSDIFCFLLDSTYFPNGPPSGMCPWVNWSVSQSVCESIMVCFAFVELSQMASYFYGLYYSSVKSIEVARNLLVICYHLPH
jgi:hypothetical protein